MYGGVRQQLGEVLRQLARHRESQVEEGHLLPDHVHMLVSIPPKYSVAQVIGYLKGKSAIHIAREFAGRSRATSWGSTSGRAGILSRTVGRDERIIRDYIQSAGARRSGAGSAVVGLERSHLRVAQVAAHAVTSCRFERLTTESLRLCRGILTQSPTLTAAATQMGVIMGTAAYMSPEQARGKPVDRRADIWAFGCVFYEMLTGRRVFEIEDVSLTLADVMRAEPAWERLPKELSPVLHTYLKRCLEKDPRQRMRDIGDMRLALEGAFETTTTSPIEPTAPPDLAVWQRPAPAVALGLMFAVMTGFVVWIATRADVVPAEVMRFAWVTPASYAAGPGREFAISSDGTQVAYRGTSGGITGGTVSASHRRARRHVILPGRPQLVDATKRLNTSDVASTPTLLEVDY